jgi:Protein of unknown function (DUF3017)
VTPERLGPLWAGMALAVVLSLLVVLLGDVRIGGFALGGALLLAALVRGIAPEDHAFALKVRTRWVDVLTYVALAAAVIVIFGSLKLT